MFIFQANDTQFATHVVMKQNIFRVFVLFRFYLNDVSVITIINSTSKRIQGIIFGGSSQVLWGLPTQCHERSKVLRKFFFTAAKATRPFAAHGKKDMLEWLRVPRWLFTDFYRYHFYRHAKKKNGNIAKVLIILHHLTKLHAFMGKVKNTLQIIEKRCSAFNFWIIQMR